MKWIGNLKRMCVKTTRNGSVTTAIIPEPVSDKVKHSVLLKPLAFCYEVATTSVQNEAILLLRWRHLYKWRTVNKRRFIPKLLFVRLYIRPSVFLSVHLSVNQLAYSISTSIICLCSFLSIYIVCLFILLYAYSSHASYLSLCLSACLFICLYVYCVALPVFPTCTYACLTYLFIPCQSTHF
jgi:hypothetical protein